MALACLKTDLSAFEVSSAFHFITLNYLKERKKERKKETIEVCVCEREREKERERELSAHVV